MDTMDENKILSMVLFTKLLTIPPFVSFNLLILSMVLFTKLLTYGPEFNYAMGF